MAWTKGTRILLPNERIVAVFHIVGEQGKKNITWPPFHKSTDYQVNMVKNSVYLKLIPNSKHHTGVCKLRSEPQVMGMLRVEQS